MSNKNPDLTFTVMSDAGDWETFQRDAVKVLLELMDYHGMPGSVGDEYANETTYTDAERWIKLPYLRESRS